jgi:hypothetical protein
LKMAKKYGMLKNQVKQFKD